MAILAPGSGFHVSLLEEDSYNAPWETFLVAPESPFSIEYDEGSKELNIGGLTPLTSHETLQSLSSLCNRYSVSRRQLHIALATALLLPTHDQSICEAALPRPEKRNTGLSMPKTCSEDLDQLYSDVPYYITLSYGCDVINSSFCGVFWDSQIAGNVAGLYLQPLWMFRGFQDAPPRF